MKLIVRVNMFTATQMAYITNSNGEVSKSFAVSTNRLGPEIVSICDKENINEIIISGPTVYTKGFEKKVREIELMKYNKHILDIQLIK